MAEDSTPAIGPEEAFNADADDVQTPWYHLLFGVRRSVLYHTHRRRHFDNLYRWKTGISLLAASTAMVTLQTQLRDALPLVPLLASAVVTVVSTVELVVGTTTKARLHADLARRFLDLERAMLLS